MEILNDEILTKTIKEEFQELGRINLEKDFIESIVKFIKFHKLEVKKVVDEWMSYIIPIDIKFSDNKWSNSLQDFFKIYVKNKGRFSKKSCSNSPEIYTSSTNEYRSPSSLRALDSILKNSLTNNAQNSDDEIRSIYGVAPDKINSPLLEKQVNIKIINSNDKKRKTLFNTKIERKLVINFLNENNNKYLILYSPVTNQAQRMNDLLLRFEKQVSMYNYCIHDPNNQSSEKCYVVGMINKRGDSNELILEFSSHFNFKALKMNFSGIPSDIDIVIITGEIVLLECANLVNDQLFVEKIVRDNRFFNNKTDFKNVLLSNDENMNHDSSKDINILCACGPFNPVSQINFDLLLSFLSNIVKQQTHHLIILLGPFITESSINSLYEEENSTKITTNAQTLFSDLIIQVHSLVEGTNVKIAFVPSLDDINSINVYPQCSITDLHDSNIDILENPSVFKIDKYTIAINNIDILKQIAQNEHILRLNNSSGQIDRYFTYMLNQGCLYPINKVSNIPIDWGLLSKKCLINDHLDVLITISDIKPFVKLVDNVICINPGRFIKYNVPGTYVSLNLSSKTNENEKLFVSSIQHLTIE